MWVLTALMMLPAAVFADSYLEIPFDRYTESYMAAIRRRTGAATAEIRADAHRFMGEVCDRHHGCMHASDVKVKQEEPARSRNQFETVKPFAHLPVWM